MLCTVQWKRRADGTQPEETMYTNTEVKKQCPEILCEFYERIANI
jgi:hypothetical protein